MHFIKSTAVLAALTSLVTAAPASSSSLSPALSPSSCTTIYPTIARVDESLPQASYLPGFHVSQESSGSGKQDVFAEFTVPEGVWGCTLSYYFPAGEPVHNIGEGNGPPAVEVFSVTPAGLLSRTPRGIDISWDNSPAKKNLVGSVQFESSPWQATSRVVNSFACESTMTYRLSVSEGQMGRAGVEFVQSEEAGLRMSYNC
ncbi:hypothetical protein ASPVEDRAFT_45447 [Aspergillus versicolor CBS 583.65]|uniref:Ubiquitin 3 binding protein But2 C-terminal domain-containing protein n=1 Tax=Aspergillus versicolor CBS 583.65 TaxID=1036611 RepID=A0A1L9PWY4_ASPVE|nr:uncharacterized protein ASPVEDRAFT_45447 [Aspergillus versicolor CBS 583.65]OJJ06027.1 hypothetical protein ASPVEDRAFT_45447 [Aspergillus versicolor CBS 583.65]